MAMIIETDVEQLNDSLQCLSLHDHQSKSKLKSKSVENEVREEQIECGENSSDHHGVCAICFNKILLEDTALVRGCEHAYCVICILHWASYKKEPTCPQCKHPFDFLHIHRSLDGSIKDYMFEESVCLLLRASWFKHVVVEKHEEVNDSIEDFFIYEEYDDLDEQLDEDLDEEYFGRSSYLRIGNRRWGDNGYVQSGRQEARPVHRPNSQDYVAGPSLQPRKKEVSKETVGRRAKRAQKREAADKVAAEKHQQQRLIKLGRA
ncbi:hypothetical protein LIER_08670 [Lithospermum erythrorhizon]|uniref:RING-type domain-containing protein n=1 Tax=Lithospermum erythrorhizon TaxID=34254 RepID=A0AAV3PCZ7_LITER